MASKNNPKERNQTKEVVRICDDCGNSGVIDKDVQRILRATGGKRTFIWRCKDECMK